MPVNQSSNGKNQLYPIPEAKAKLKIDKTLRAELNSNPQKRSIGNTSHRAESIEIKKTPSQNQKSVLPRLKLRVATLIGSLVILPILALGTATYYFADREIDRQIVLADPTGNRVIPTESVRQRNLLSAWLIGTGTTALVAGVAASLATRRLLDKVSEVSRVHQAGANKSVLDLNWQQNIFQAIVEEARTELNCDRVVVYSLEPHKYGVIIAESVVAGYTQAIGKTIEESGLKAKHLAKYRYGGIRAVNDIERSNLSARYREQLRQLQVKASLVTPILHRSNLLGLLVAHQCDAPLAWQQSEINLLHQLAKKAGLLIENARIGDRLTRLQTKAERERKWTHYFDDTVRHIHQFSEPDSVLETSVEQIQRVLKCDRVMVYSLESDRYGLVVAESVSAGYSRATNHPIEAAGLEAQLDYRDGIRVIDNIYEVETSPFSIEQLEALEAKASLITPMFSQGKLSALLVAHQCDRFRSWQDYEIRWMSLIATQVSLALDNAQVVAKSITLKDRAEVVKKWTHYFDDTVRHIRQSSEPDDVWEISVEQVHRVLKCDRVIVYSLEGDRYGRVLAESISAGYSRATNHPIEAAGLEAQLDYRDGIRVIDNIYEAQISSDHIEQLEALEVKASLITPVFSRGELSALLVAHQCDRSRNWQDYEIHWISQIATQVGLALDNASLLKKWQQDKLAAQLLNAFSFKIRETTDTKLLSTAVEQVREIMKLDRVIVCQFDDGDRVMISAESVVQGYRRASDLVEDFVLTKEYKTKSSQTQVEAIADIDRAKIDSNLEKLKSLEIKASISVPILRDRQLFGLLIGHQCQQPRSWSQWETDLFTQLAGQIGSVLERVPLEEPNRKNDPISEAEQFELTESYDLENNLAAIEAVAETIDIENIDGSQPNLHQMLGTLHDLAENTDRPTEVKLTQIPTEDVTVTEEIIFNSAQRHSSESELIIDVQRSPENMTDLSERILQQSSLVTESFEKLAMYAKQLSEKDKT